jgi:hypothetical protein
VAGEPEAVGGAKANLALLRTPMKDGAVLGGGAPGQQSDDCDESGYRQRPAHVRHSSMSTLTCQP